MKEKQIPGKEEASEIAATANLKMILPPLIELAIIQLACQGGPTQADFTRAQEIGFTLATTGDAFQWKKAISAGGKPPPIGQIAKALACAAWAPGGLTLWDHHWERGPHVR